MISIATRLNSGRKGGGGGGGGDEKQPSMHSDK